MECPDRGRGEGGFSRTLKGTKRLNAENKVQRKEKGEKSNTEKEGGGEERNRGVGGFGWSVFRCLAVTAWVSPLTPPQLIIPAFLHRDTPLPTDTVCVCVWVCVHVCVSF